LGRRLLNICALLSIPAIVLLGLGYVCELGVSLYYVDGIGGNWNLQNIEPRVDAGRVAILWVEYPPPTKVVAESRFAIRWHPPRFHPPNVRRSIWEFDAHFIPVPYGNRVFLLAFPIWCVLLPALIPGWLWLRRGTKQSQGFPMRTTGDDTTNRSSITA
jgi:hypothetical protein